MFKRSFFAVAFATATSMSAHADEINYNYIELGIDRGDYGNGALIQDGINLSGSVAITEHFYISGVYREADLQSEDFVWGMTFRSESDFDYRNLNFGYRQSLDENNDLITELGYEHHKLKSQFFVDDVASTPLESSFNNYRAIVGIRTSINNHWETIVKLGLKEGGTTTYAAGRIDLRPVAELGISYKVNPTWAVNFDTKMDSFGISRYGLGVRAYFYAEKSDSSKAASSDTEFSYTYLQTGITGFERFYDGGWVSGYDLRGSYEFANNFHAHARIAEFNTAELQLHDERQYEIGLGYHRGITSSNDFIVNVSRGTVDSGCTIFECTKESGYNVSVGLRTAITEKLQTKAMLGYNFGGNRYMYDRKSVANIDIGYSIGKHFDVFFDTKLLNLYEAFYTFGIRAKF